MDYNICSVKNSRVESAAAKPGIQHKGQIERRPVKIYIVRAESVALKNLHDVFFVFKLLPFLVYKMHFVKLNRLEGRGFPID